MITTQVSEIEAGGNQMKIALVVGHSILKSGSCTSASGVVNEYYYNKELVPLIAKYVKKACPDWQVVTIICPEKKFMTKAGEKSHKLNLINGSGFNRVYEFHLNCSDGKGRGTEQLYVSSSGKKLAQQNQNGMKDLFKDRGIKYRDNLYMLNQTDCPTVICETFFCDNESDYAIGKDRDKIARIYAQQITGKKIEAGLQATGSNAKKVYGRVATKKDPLRMRKTASSVGKVLQTIPKGAKVEVISKGKTWHKCKYNGMTGYCSSKYIALL